ncbi:MAG: histidine kinase [Cytophagales bacterium]
MDKTNAAIEKMLPRKLIKLYVLALSFVALFLIIAQIVIQVSIIDQQSDSRVVNIAGRQRMLSQKLCKTSILLGNPTIYLPDAELYISDLDDILELWSTCHFGLMNGKLELDATIFVKNSSNLDSMYAAINPIFNVIYTNARNISKEMNNPSLQKNDIIKSSLIQILQNEQAFLKAMDAIVFRYDAEAKKRVEALKRIEILLFGITLIILFLEGIFIFLPTYKQIDFALNALVNREKELEEANVQLIAANLVVSNAKTELLAATQEKYQLQIQQDKVRNWSLIKGQEEERKRISLELHDGIGQMLTGIKLIAENLNSNVFSLEKDRQTFDDLKQLLNDTIAETRIISFNLMPAVLNDFGIFSALRMLIEQTKKNASIQFDFNTNGLEFRFNRNIEINIYRICQEAINNTIKHASATNVSININILTDSILIKYTDNGIGFDSKKVNKNSLKNGLNNIKARTELLNGNLVLASAKGKGIKIEINLPLQMDNNFEYHNA